MQFLRELLAESISHQMASDTINSAGRSLVVATKDANEKLKDALEWNDPGQMLPSIAPVTKWFRDNYRTNRKDGGYGVESALTQLKDTKAFKPLVARAFSMIDDNAIRGNQKVSKNKQLIGLGLAMADMIEKLPSTHLGNKADSRGYQITSKELRRELQTFQSNVSRLARIKMRDRGIDKSAADEQKVAKQKKNARGDQAQQAEQLVNSVLASLPKDVAGEIRQLVQRSGNPLATLQSELSARGLG